jgi:hypothetical protein
LNSPISVGSSRKIEAKEAEGGKQRVITMPKVASPLLVSSCGKSIDHVSASTAAAASPSTVSPANRVMQRRQNIQDAGLHRWAMDEAAYVTQNNEDEDKRLLEEKERADVNMHS